MKKIILSILCAFMFFSLAASSLTAYAAPKNTATTSISKVESKAKSFKVTWKKKSKINGYQIQYSTSSKFKKADTKTKTITKAKTTTATVSKLKGCNKKYYVRVRTYKVINGKKIYSSWSKTKSVTTLKHKYSKATCTKAKTCKYCGKTSGKKLGHKWSSATCTKAKTCSRCNKTSGKALEHTWSNWTTVVAAEIGNPGTEKRTCSRCQKNETKTIPALKEDYAKKWFIAQYNVAKQQYTNSLHQDKTSKQDEITTLKISIDNISDWYASERVRILKNYPDSETRNIMLYNLQQNQTSDVRPYKEKISNLEAEIAIIDVEISNPNVDNILAIVTRNCNISFIETYEYYDKYSKDI